MFHLQRDSDVHVHWKGAAEIVLALCTSWIDADGSIHELTSDKVETLVAFRFTPPFLKMSFLDLA